VRRVEAPTITEEITRKDNDKSSLDIAKSVFQVHGVDDAGQVVIRRKVKRRTSWRFFQKLPPCLVA